MQIEEYENEILKVLKNRGLSIRNVKVCEVCRRKAFLITSDGSTFIYEVDNDFLYGYEGAWVNPVCDDCLMEMFTRELLYKLQQYSLIPSYSFTKTGKFYRLEILGYKRYRFAGLTEINDIIERLISEVFWKHKSKLVYNGGIEIDDDVLYEPEVLELGVLLEVIDRPYSHNRPIRNPIDAALTFALMEDLDVKLSLEEFEEKGYLLSADRTSAIARKDVDLPFINGELIAFRGIDRFDEVIYRGENGATFKFTDLKRYRKVFKLVKKHISGNKEPILVLEGKHIYLIKAPYIG